MLIASYIAWVTNDIAFTLNTTASVHKAIALSGKVLPLLLNHVNLCNAVMVAILELTVPILNFCCVCNFMNTCIHTHKQYVFRTLRQTSMIYWWNDIYRLIYVKRYLLTYLNFSLFIRPFIPTLILHRHPLVCDSLAQQKTSACWLQSSVSTTAMTSRSGSSTSGPLGSLQPDRAPPWLWVDEPCSVNDTQWNHLKGHPWIKDTSLFRSLDQAPTPCN